MQRNKNFGLVYLVSVPIGNNGDITLRAIEILKNVKIIACEDTRKSGILLKNLNIKNKLISYHSYSNFRKVDILINHLKNGDDLALISDGGTPGISDPGAELIRKCREENITIIPIPGVSALATALSVSGFSSSGVYFAGFISPKSGKRKKILTNAAKISNTIVVYESPKRIKKFLKDVYFSLGNVDILVCREMTKIHEEYRLLNISDIDGIDIVEKGEFTVVINVKSIK